MEEEKKLLFIVDPQYDFINGSLPVPNADIAMDALCDYLKDNVENYAAVVISLDWHPWMHCSFDSYENPETSERGQWPRHCVMHSRGAAVWDRLLEVLDGTDVYMLNKGYQPDKEEYSLLQCQESTFTFRNIMSEYEITDVDFCGIVREICVMNTMKDFMKMYEDVNVRVLLDYTPTLDGGVEFDKFLENHLEVLTVKSAI